MLGEDLERLAQTRQHGGFVADAVVEDADVAVTMFDRFGARRVALARQQSGENAVARRLASVQWFGHAAEARAQAAGRRRGDAQRHGHALFAEPEQAAGCGGSRQGAEGAGGVPAALVMLRVERAAELAEELEAHHVGVDQGAAARGHQRRDGEQGGGEHGAGMGVGGVVGVVEVERVCDGAVVQRGIGRRGIAPPAQQQRREGGIGCVERGQRGAQRRGQRLGAASQHATHAVGHGVARTLARQAREAVRRAGVARHQAGQGQRRVGHAASHAIRISPARRPPSRPARRATRSAG